jgi:hypothetical protein
MYTSIKLNFPKIISISEYIIINHTLNNNNQDTTQNRSSGFREMLEFNNHYFCAISINLP